MKKNLQPRNPKWPNDEANDRFRYCNHDWTGSQRRCPRKIQIKERNAGLSSLHATENCTILWGRTVPLAWNWFCRAGRSTVWSYVLFVRRFRIGSVAKHDRGE